MPAKPPIRILLAEDDETMGYLLEDTLTTAGYQVHLCTDGQRVLSAFINHPCELVILDVMLPGQDGFSLALQIRRLNQHIPIIFLTARSDKQDRIQGFKVGGDDYLTKPFSLEELLLRLEAILKRSYQVPSRADEQLGCRFGNSWLDVGNQRLHIGESVHELTHKEAKLLELFCRHPNQIILRDSLQKAIWEEEGYFVGRSLDVFVSRLRKLLQDEPSVRITNIHATGYRFEVDMVRP
jgi:DNA-binding response OmpR family regulator